MANGWTLERRARQAAQILTWRPWDLSTGPKTAAGKARSSRNADKPEFFNRRIRAVKKQVAALVSQAKQIDCFFNDQCSIPSLGIHKGSD